MHIYDFPYKCITTVDDCADGLACQDQKLFSVLHTCIEGMRDLRCCHFTLKEVQQYDFYKSVNIKDRQH